MKNYLIYIFSLFILTNIFLFSCQENKVYKIGISQCSTDDWRTKMNDEILREAMLHNDVEVEIRSADDSNKKQIEDIRYFADNGFDMIIASPNEAAAITPVIEEVYDRGIPVIIFDRNTNSNKYTSRIAVDNIGLGSSAAIYARHLLGDSLKAIEIYGLPGSSPAEDRHKGFLKELGVKKSQLLGSGAANWKMEPAERVTDSLLKIYPETNLIFAHNDRMALGAAKVAEKMGREDIRIIGIDAAPEIGIQAVAEGVIDATFLYPTEGHRVLREAINILHGNPYSKELILPMASAVDSSNADILLLQNETLIDDTNKIIKLKGQLDDYWQKHSAQTSLVYAIIIILLLVFGVLFLVLRMFWQNRKYQSNLMTQNKLLEEERDKQKELNQKLEEATQSKLVFFTNVSHDLRTPLTLIAEPVSQLKNSENLDQKQHKLMQIADKNVKILHRLINQILDFRKFENNKLELNLTEINFRQALKEWLESFYAVAKKRDISLTLNEPEGDDPILIAIDIEKIERVFFNLISNALKYSPDNSDITVNYSIEKDNIILKVKDTGEGISDRDLGHIFDRFFQVDRVRPRGSGIGLSLAKAFVELHGGTITVESQLNKGSEFTVSIPIKHIDAKPVETIISNAKDEIEAEFEEINETEINFDKDKPILLVIDDNQDILGLVTELMKDDYNIITSSNGKAGIKKAAKYVPDLIICDVMMPGIDGLEVCSRLKSETATSHIPVLMLTACSMDEQRVQGFDSGADGYLSKPFSSAVLHSQAKSLISNRRRIKNLYENNLTKSPDNHPEKPELKVKDTLNKRDPESDFYERFVIILEKDISNPDLNVEYLAAEMGLERTQFYRKIKAITNYSPVELVRSLRLKKARNLLMASDRSISEIGYEVGFSNPAYFTKCYKEQFGETPSETRQKIYSN